MVDLRVRQQHARDRCGADSVDLAGLESFELLTGVRRGVD
jgi:hypothetical protein